MARVLGWERMRTAEAWGRPFIMPSPNMPTLDTAIVYPGTYAEFLWHKEHPEDLQGGRTAGLQDGRNTGERSISFNTG